jgi:hypothetical protein
MAVRRRHEPRPDRRLAPRRQGIAWKQQLTLAFTNPANRQRALLFERKEGVMEVLQAPDPGAGAAALVAAVVSGNDDPKAISIERARSSPPTPVNRPWPIKRSGKWSSKSRSCSPISRPWRNLAWA